MGSKIVKIFFSEDQLIHVMRFPTTISSRVGLARDSAMEINWVLYVSDNRERNNCYNPNIERSSFVHQLPKPRVT